MNSADDPKTNLLLELIARLKANNYPLIQSLPSVHTYPTFLGLAKEIATVPPWVVSRSNQHRLFDPSRFAKHYHQRFQRKYPQAFLLYTLFFVNHSVEQQGLIDCLGERLVKDLIHAGFLNTSNGKVSATLRVVPYRENLLLTDPWDREIEGFAYIGKDSIDMAEFLRKRLGDQRFARGLDICTGGGIHALLLADRCERVIGVDINPRALAYCQRNALINAKANVQYLRSDLVSALKGRFDIIVSNPPLRFLPDDQKRSNRDGFGGGLGIELTGKIAASLEGLLADGGIACIGSVAPVVNGVNCLLQDLTEIFSGKPFQVELVHTDLSYSLENGRLHQQHGISYLLPCFIMVKKALPAQVKVTDQISYKQVKKAMTRWRWARWESRKERAYA